MANVLKRDLKKGDKLVLSDGEVAEVTLQTSGCRFGTIGTKIGVSIDGRNSIMIDGVRGIDVVQTMKRFAAVNGWK